MREIYEIAREAFRDATAAEIIGDAIGALSLFALVPAILILAHGLGY